ncbi:MAG: Bax inhibitor-1 family protein [Lachnospiraceae bacterium]|nr:Bax inhibitor-1 family protein [Lachnospiraceae bacterium]
MNKKSNAELRQERIFEQYEESEIVSDSTYNLVIGLTICAGFLLNFFVISYFAESLLEMSYMVSILLYLGLSFGGMAIAYKSKSAVVSFMGFLLLATGFSVILAGIVYMYAPETVIAAIYVTLGATAVMMLLSTAFPRFFLSLGKTLFFSLLAVIVVEIVMLIAGIIEPTAIDFLVALIFCGYIGFDWSRAQRYPKTINNAIDASVDIYVDIVNLFVRVLSILGKRD